MSRGDDLSINPSLFSRGFLVLQDPMRNTHSSNFQRMSKCTVLCVLYQSQELSPMTECVSCVDYSRSQGAQSPGRFAGMRLNLDCDDQCDDTTV